MKNKKFIVFFSLFIVPLLFYIFLSLGIYKYANLPILTENVVDIKGDETFKDHFSIVCFFGDDFKASKDAISNVNEVIYKRFSGNIHFQTVVILPKGMEEQAKELHKRLGMYTDASKWKFVFVSKEELVAIFNSFDTPYTLDDHFASTHTFIIDRKLRLRGRKDDEDTKDGKLYGYDMYSVADLRNKMRKDIKVIYYQLKKSMEKEKRRKRERELLK